MTRELQTTLEASGIEWCALRNHIPCMAHVIELAQGGFMSSHGVKGRTKSWEAHECDQQFGANESINIGKSQKLRKEGNARIKKVSAMRPGLAKILEKVCISRYFESLETDLHIAENACCIYYADTWSSKPVHWRLKSQSPHDSTNNYGCEDKLELHTAVAWASLPIVRIHLWVAFKSKIQQLLATLHNTGSMHHYPVCHGSFKAIPIFDPGIWKRHTVTLHQIITVYNDMFDHMARIKRALAMKMTQCMEDLFFAMNLAWQRLSKYYAEVTLTMHMVRISAHILNLSWQSWSFQKWDKEMVLNPEDETFYTTQYDETYLK